MKNSKQLQFIIAIVIIVIGLAWIGYQQLSRKSTIKIPVEPQKCGIENCHGIDISCGPDIPQGCTDIYLLGDFCREYISCEIVDNQCQLVEKPKFNQCKSCVKECEQLNDNDALDCENECRKALTDIPSDGLGEEETKETTISSLLANLEKYDSQPITVTGKYKKSGYKAIPMCKPTGTGKNSIIKETYRIYPSSWILTELNDEYKELGIIVISEKGVQISTLPNYTEGQQVTLQGVAKFTTVQDNCSRDIRYKSIYLEVRAEDINIDTKALPDSSTLDLGDTVSDWNSFIHKVYNYTVKFPNNWHWDGTDVNILVISAEEIVSQDEALTANNLKIVKADQEILETDVEIISLGKKFKAVYLKNHNYKDIVDQIISSFKIN